MSRAEELVELIRGRIHSEFDGECHLTDTEAHAIADFLSEAERRVKNARREALEEAARYHEYLAKMLRGSRRGKTHLGYASHLRALIPSEPHDAAGRENPRRGDPSIFDDAEGRN